MIISATDYAEPHRLDENGMTHVLRGFDGVPWAYNDDGDGAKLPKNALLCLSPFDDPMNIKDALRSE